MSASSEGDSPAAALACPLVSNIQSFAGTSLIGATIEEPEAILGGNEVYPSAIVLLKNGRFLRRFDGQPFYWDWTFWNHGRQLVTDSSRLHGSQLFTLISVRTGKQLAGFEEQQDSSHDPPWAIEIARRGVARGGAPLPPFTRDCRFRSPDPTLPGNR